MDSYKISNRTINKVLKNEEFPWLISFPRTGSHWLRMLLELYFDKPSLVRVFFLKPTFRQKIIGYRNSDFTCYHRHDVDLDDVGMSNVLYLYREPVATIYSQMSYHHEDLKNRERVLFWSEKYARHLGKWLIGETFTKNKTIITYEDMCSDLNGVFIKICEFFGVIFNESKLNTIKEQVSKKTLKKKTKHDSNVVKLDTSYNEKREKFREEFLKDIYNCLDSVDPKLPELFCTRY